LGTHTFVPAADAPVATTANSTEARHAAKTTPRRALNALMLTTSMQSRRTGRRPR